MRVLAPSGPQWVRRLDEWHLLTPLRIVIIVAVAVLLTVVVRRLVNRVLRRTIVVPGADRIRADARQQALADTLRSASVGIIWSVAVITIISEVGVNIGGLVATATVVGGAVAFGAQTLIRDLIGGFFVLAEDQYGVGDEVDLGVCQGIVERISLRSVRLRDGEDVVWHVAHGNVVRVANLNQTSLVVLDLELDRAMPVGAAEALADRLAGGIHAVLGEIVDLPQTRPVPDVVGLVRLTEDRQVHRLRVHLGRPGTPSEISAVRRRWRRLVLEALDAGETVAQDGAGLQPGRPKT